MTTHSCFATSCETQISLDMLMCPAHWRRVPKHVQTQVWVTWRIVSQARSASAEELEQYSEARTRARLCVLALERNKAERPVLHLGHPSSPKAHDVGHKWCGMGRPREWERGEGRVEQLAPSPDRVKRWNEDKIRLASDEFLIQGQRIYREAFENRLAEHLERGHLVPGVLAAKPWSDEDTPFLHHGSNSRIVTDGDTVWCACGRDKALSGRCHLSWAVPFLVKSGWTVSLYGEIHPTPKRQPQLGLFT